TEGSPSNYYTQKFFEVQKHMSLTSHNHLSYALIANKQFWDSLPSDVRPVLDQAIKDATEFGNSLAKKKNDEALAAIIASGKTTVYTLTPVEKAAWIKALLPVHKEMASRIGQETVDAVYKATGFKG
ncbi:MAG: TRAP transporter substrate-binding protein DctP, partial [Aestuariivirga sp.]